MQGAEEEGETGEEGEEAAEELLDQPDGRLHL